jgi:hypothetical protein
MNRALLVYVLKQLLIEKDSPEGNSNVKAKNLLHLEKLRKKTENKFACFINLILI